MVEGAVDCGLGDVGLVERACLGDVVALSAELTSCATALVPMRLRFMGVRSFFLGFAADTLENDASLIVRVDLPTFSTR